MMYDIVCVPHWVAGVLTAFPGVVWLRLLS